LIAGDELTSHDMPDRALMAGVRRQRRQPNANEKFMGRIRALLPDGSYEEIGAGSIALPPEPEAPAQTWGQPAPMFGPSPAMPYGGGPPWWNGWGGGGGYGMGPWGAGPWGMGSPMQAMQQQLSELRAQLAKPPDAIAGNPALVEMWRFMQTMVETNRATAANGASGQNELLFKVLDMFAANARPTGGATPDPLDLVDKVVTLADKLRGPPAAAGKSGINIHKVGDATLLEDKDGNLDVGGSVALSVISDAKDALKAWSAGRKVAAQTANGGARPPTARATAGAPVQPPKLNGAGSNANGNGAK
jgi:hypothetical protein